MERIPILRMGEFLLVTIQVEMHDRIASGLKDDLLRRIAETNAKGVLIDSGGDVVDSFLARMFVAIAQMSRVMDARTVVAGMRPAVAMTLVEMGIPMAGIVVFRQPQIPA